MVANELDVLALGWLAYRRNPDAFCEEQLNSPNDPWQSAAFAELINPECRFLYISSCHGTGKTHLVAKMILWAGTTWGRVRIPATAPKEATLTRKLWPEINKLLIGASPLLRSGVQWTNTRVIFFGIPGWEALAETSNQTEAAAGHHDDRVLVLVEEATGVQDRFWAVYRGAMSTPGSKLVAISNPTRKSGHFAGAFKRPIESARLIRVGWNPRGIESVMTMDQDSLRTRDPLVPEIEHTGRDVVVQRWYSDRPDGKWARDLIDEFGWDSDIVRVRVRGLDPLEDEHSLVPASAVWAAYGRAGLDEDKLAPLVWTWDVAGAGRDRSIQSSRRGTFINAIIMASSDNTYLAAMSLAEGINQEKPDIVNIDAIGIGTGPADALIAKGYAVNDVNVGVAATDPEKYGNLRAEAYWKLRADFLKGHIAISKSVPEAMVQSLAEELEATKWRFNLQNKIMIAPKDEIKEELGRSPDVADALMLHHTGGGYSGSFEIIGTMEASRADW